MRYTIGIIGAGMLLAVFGCERGATPAAGPAAPAAPASAAANVPAVAEAVRLLRGPGESRYRLTMLGYNQLRELRVNQTTEFLLKTAADGSESVEVLSAARVLPPARDPEPLVIDAECRQAFKGDEQVLGRFAFTPTAMRRPNEVIPECVARDLFGAVTDILTLLSVQSREYALDQLRAAGDKAAFAGFEANWTQLPDVSHGRLVCAGGEVVLERVEGGRAYVRWQPQPIDLATLRTTRAGMANLIGGTEKLSILATIDATNGTLLEAHCELDELDLQGWSPFRGDSVPDRKDWPKTSGLPMKAWRELKLERLPTAPG